jgi:TolB-like protein
MFDRLERQWKSLREHPAFRMGAVYSGSAFVLLQVMDLLGFATSVVRWTGVGLAVGLIVLVVALVVAHHHLAPVLSIARVPRGRRLVAALVLMLVLGTGAWWAGARLVASPVAPGAEAIAVLPFTASGQGVEALGEGMVDLLSTSLDQVGGVRAIHPRTVLHRWSRLADGGMLDLDGALALGRDVGAGSVLLGSLVGAGDRIRLTAELYTLDGRRIGEARSEGDAATVLALVDDLAVRILREVWRSRQPIPSLRLEAITTSSVEALQHYLRGERFYRAAQWDSVLVAMTEAVARDSTFALAHLRLAETLGWVHHHGHPDGVAAARTAVRFADRLPARERSLAQVYLLHSEADPAGVDSAESYARRYPDDAMGWYLLGDVRFHAQQLFGFTVDDVVAPIDSMYRLDPGLSAPFVHPMEVAYMSGDSALYYRHLDRFERAGGDGTRWRRQGATRWASPDSFPDRFRRDFRDLEVGRVPMGSWFLWSAAPIFRPDMDPDLTDRVVDGIRIDEREGATEQERAELRVWFHLMRGRVDRAIDEARLALDQGVPAWRLFAPLFQASMTGVVDEAHVAPYIPRGEGAPPTEWFEKFFGLSQGDLARATAVDFGPATELDDEAPPWAHGILEAVQGWELVLGGNTRAGLEAIRSGIQAADYASGATSALTPLLFHVAAHLTRTDATRDEGIRHLEAIRLRAEPVYRVPASVVLAEAYHARGDRDAAARHYADVVRLWDQADDHLQPTVDDARRALARLRVD